jgi:hypothetical protein
VRFPLGRPEGRRSRKCHQPLYYPPQRLFFRIEGFKCCIPLVVPPHFELAGKRRLQAVHLGFQSWVPGDLPPPPQPVLQAYFILNAGRNRSTWIVTWAAFGSKACTTTPDTLPTT